jgi:hypothetical protein
MAPDRAIVRMIAVGMVMVMVAPPPISTALTGSSNIATRIRAKTIHSRAVGLGIEMAVCSSDKTVIVVGAHGTSCA